MWRRAGSGSACSSPRPCWNARAPSSFSPIGRRRRRAPACGCAGHGLISSKARSRRCDRGTRNRGQPGRLLGTFGVGLPLIAGFFDCQEFMLTGVVGCDRPNIYVERDGKRAIGARSVLLEASMAMAESRAAGIPGDRTLLIVEDDKSFLQRLASA